VSGRQNNHRDTEVTEKDKREKGGGEKPQRRGGAEKDRGGREAELESGGEAAAEVQNQGNEKDATA
jgi:hypothetical protein